MPTLLNNIKVLILGEIIGRPGRTKVKEVLPALLKEHSPDFVIANGEHLAGGKGVSEKKVKELKAVGINFFTTGNHVFSKPGVDKILDNPREVIVRPANFPEDTPGKEYKTLKVKGKKFLIINLLGKAFINKEVDDPFIKVDQILKKEKADIIIVDMHAETTSEKVLMGDYLNGRVSIVFGTHTHVPTSDLRILDRGTFYVTDIGMIGPVDSVIGMRKDVSQERILRDIPAKYEVATMGPSFFNAILVELDSKGKALKFDKIEKIV